MPGFIACKLCPELIFVPVDFKKYTHYSDLTRQVFREYDSNFTAASLVEAYLDITKVCKERDITASEVAEELRQNVYKATGLTCSAPNRLLAKVCSDINKPNGQFLLPNDRDAIMTFISSLPIRKIGGIGKVTEHILKDVFDIKTFEDLLQKSSFLCALFSPSSADFFISVGLGIGGTDAPQVRSRKSMSNERTVSATKDEAFFYQKLGDKKFLSSINLTFELSDMLSADMEKEGLYGRTLTLKLKTASFEVRTRAVTLQSYTRSSKEILKHASKLLKAELPVSLRLMGLRMSHFNEDKGGTQRTLLNFIKPEGSNKEVVDEEDSDVKDGYETHCHIYTDPSCDHLSELNQNTCTSGDNNEEGVEHGGLEGNECKDQVNEETLIEQSVKSSELDADEGRNPDLLARVAFSDNERQLLMWLDDYKCSLCGAELPPTFVEERQEHSDFHLAEKLQEEEEPGHIYNNLPLKHRMSQKEAAVRQSKRKKKQKQSTSNSKHIPIDSFFTKRNHNL